MRLQLPNEKKPGEMFVGAVPTGAEMPGAVVGFCRVRERVVPGSAILASKVDDVAVAKAFPLLGMVDELMDRCVVRLQRSGHERIRLSFEVEPKLGAPQDACRMG